VKKHVKSTNTPLNVAYIAKLNFLWPPSLPRVEADASCTAQTPIPTGINIGDIRANLQPAVARRGTI
jgi:hypothetical protein